MRVQEAPSAARGCRVRNTSRNGEVSTARAKRVRQQTLELAAQGVGPASIAVRIGADLREVRKALLSAGLWESEDGVSPKRIAERLGVPLEEYVQERAAGRFRCRHHAGGIGAWLPIRQRSYSHGASDVCKPCFRARHAEDPQTPKWRRLRGTVPTRKGSSG